MTLASPAHRGEFEDRAHGQRGRSIVSASLDTICTASNESPPNAKKLLLRVIPVTCRRSFQMSAISASIGVNGAASISPTAGVRSNAGGSSARRSVLPLARSGSAVTSS